MAEPKLPHFPFYPSDFLFGTSLMSNEARGVYISLLCWEWQIGPFPNDKAAIERMVKGASSVWGEIGCKFNTCDGLLFNERLEHERDKAKSKYLQKCSAGSLGGKAKASERSSETLADATFSLERNSSERSSNQNQNQNQNQSQKNQIPEAAPPVAPTRGKPRSKPQVVGICWTVESGWSGITEADRSAWSRAYPACDIDRQLAAAGEWCLANPAKARKSNWRKFLTNWLTRQQDRGGDVKSNKPEAAGW